MDFEGSLALSLSLSLSVTHRQPIEGLRRSKFRTLQVSWNHQHVGGRDIYVLSGQSFVLFVIFDQTSTLQRGAQ